jgi:hypothetical protein
MWGSTSAAVNLGCDLTARRETDPILVIVSETLGYWAELWKRESSVAKGISCKEGSKVKQIIVLVMLFLLSSLCLGQTTPTGASPENNKHCPLPVITPTVPPIDVKAPSGTADLNSVIASVKAALQCYQANRGTGPDALPPLQQAQFDFKTTTGKVGGLSVSFFIFKIGGSMEKDTSNDITFTYALPKQTGTATKKKTPPQPLADAIVADIQSAAAAVKDGAKMGNLSFSKLTVTLQFGVQFDGNVAVNVPVQLVTIGASGDFKKSEVQTVTLTFASASP